MGAPGAAPRSSQPCSLSSNAEASGCTTAAGSDASGETTAAADGGAEELEKQLADGRHIRVATGTVAGPHTSPSAELHDALWVVEWAAGEIPLVTKCWYVSTGAGVLASDPTGAGREPSSRVATRTCGGAWRRIRPRCVAVGAGGWRSNWLADMAAKAAAEAREPAAWRAERREALRHLRTIDDVGAGAGVAALAEAHAGPAPAAWRRRRHPGKYTCRVGVQAARSWRPADQGGRGEGRPALPPG